MPTPQQSFFESFPPWLLILFIGIFIVGFAYQAIFTVRIYYYKKKIKNRVVGINTLIGIFTALPISILYHIYKMEGLNPDYFYSPMSGLERILAGLDFVSSALPIVGIGWLVLFQAFINKILNKRFRLMNLWGLIIVTITFFNMYFISSPPIKPCIETYHSLLLFSSVILFIVGLGMLVAMPGRTDNT